MAIWSAEIKELERLYESFKGQFPVLEKELAQLIQFGDPNVIMLYSRRCLEVIITDLCECELKRERGTEPLKGIIDKLHKDKKIPAHIVSSMHGLNELSTYGTHPKDFDPEQVKPVLNNLAIVIKWYIKYTETRDISEIAENNITVQKTEGFDKRVGALKPEKKLSKVPIISILIVLVIAVISIVYFKTRQNRNNANLEKSIAVLPFRNDSHDDSTQYFMDGVMEELLTNLQKINDLRVLGRTSVEQYRNQNKSIPQIAKELGVNYVIEGSGQKSGNSLRMRVQLIRVNKEGHIWANNFEQENLNLDDYFKIQVSFAEAIAKELNAVITPGEKQMMGKIPTLNIEAYNAYQMGRFYWRQLTPNDLNTALQYFELAKERDPNYALAYAGICYYWLGAQQMGIVSPSEAGPKAVEAAMKALELDSTSSEVHYSLAIMKYEVLWDWEGSESEFKKTIELNPNDAEVYAYYSHLLNIVGRSKEAMEQIDIALKLDPRNPLIKELYGIDLMFVHRYDEAIIAFQEALKVDPTAPVALDNMSEALHHAGRDKEALQESIRKYKNPEILQAFNSGYDEAGYTGAMSHVADALVERSKTTWVRSFAIGAHYAKAGEKDKAIYWLEKAYQEHEPNLVYLLMPHYDSLRDDPRFQDLCRKMNLPFKPIE